MTEDTVKRADEVGALQLQPVDLHLFTFDRSLHPELFRHYANYRVEQGRYYADIWVIGLGHVITVTSGHASLTELLARESELIPSRGVLSRFRLKGERDHERQTADGWNYMVSTQVETMDEALYKSVHSDLVRHAGRSGWLYSHDQWSDGELSPFTYMDHEARDREFHVHAFHAYPHENTLVKTQTIIELPA